MPTAEGNVLTPYPSRWAATSFVQEQLAKFAAEIKNTTGATRDAYRKVQEQTAAPSQGSLTGHGGRFSEGVAVNEWKLQDALTETWARDGLSVNGERLFLAAREVMTDWRINDRLRHFNLPSIDFLFLDAQGQMLALELKPKIATPRDAWSVLCQVTHRAVELKRNFAACKLKGSP
ncbi:MAG: hypothetical protein LC808_01805 [Actinobacteria bacterium]|nr:hypothetical protein [Actinomycetota bacterium]